MRGYFGIGVEGISKGHNLGAVLRTAHSFGASFAFTIDAYHTVKEVKQTDTSRSAIHLPFYEWNTPDEFVLPKGCQLVGIELTDDAVELPSFRHPLNCAYVLGPEEGSISEEMQAKCKYIVKIPTKFCINVSLAAALTLYDRTISLGGYPERPVRPGGPDLDAVENWQSPGYRRNALSRNA